MKDSDSFDAAKDELLPLLVLHAQRRDRALGLNGHGRRTRVLMGRYVRLSQDGLARLAQAAFCKAVIDECRAEAGRLIGGADTPDKRRAALPEVERLNDLAEAAARQLEVLGHD